MNPRKHFLGGEDREREFREILEAHCAKAGDTAEERTKVYEKYDVQYAAQLRRLAGKECDIMEAKDAGLFLKR